MAYKLISLARIDSTQNYAANLIASGNAADHTAVLADVQTAGRGRYRRTWVSPSGNLYVSFIFKSPERDPRLSYSVAVAIAETLASFGLIAGIKWPNDILIDGKKLGGVLIEYSRDFVIIGIGINIKSNPKVSEYETAKVSSFANVSRDEFLTVLMKNLDIWMRRGFESVRERWTDFAVSIGGIVKYRGRGMQLIGLNENGALILRDGCKYVMAYGDEISI